MNFERLQHIVGNEIYAEAVLGLITMLETLKISKPSVIQRKNPHISMRSREFLRLISLAPLTETCKRAHMAQ